MHRLIKLEKLGTASQRIVALLGIKFPLTRRQSSAGRYYVLQYCIDKLSINFFRFLR
jgi:hypothetical protein